MPFVMSVPESVISQSVISFIKRRKTKCSKIDLINIVIYGLRFLPIKRGKTVCQGLPVDSYIDPQRFDSSFFRKVKLF